MIRRLQTSGHPRENPCGSMFVYLSLMWRLDTGVCVPLFSRTDEGLAARLLDHTPGSVRLCNIVKTELYFGAQSSARLVENLRRADTFCRAFDSLPFDDESAGQYGRGNMEA